MWYTHIVMNDKRLLRIHGSFQEIMRLGNQLEKSPRKFGTEDLLSHSEIHLIEIIGDHQGFSVTDIAKNLHVTKGAISQNLKKLEYKGYSAKIADPENNSRTIVQLTAKGKTAYWAHKAWHESMDGGFSAYLNNLTGEEIETIAQFLDRVEDFLERRLKE